MVHYDLTHLTQDPTQAVLGPIQDDEALVLFLDTDARFKPLPEETFVWVVTKTSLRWVRSDLGTEALGREVTALRCGLHDTAIGLAPRGVSESEG